MAYSGVVLNSVPLNITNISAVKKQKTVKQVIGKSLSELNVVGVSGQQWELQLQGIVLGTTAANVATNRTNVEGLDAVAPYAYVDGLHNGTYYVRPGSVTFPDTGDNVNLSYRYSMQLVEQ